MKRDTYLGSPARCALLVLVWAAALTVVACDNDMNFNPAAPTLPNLRALPNVTTSSAPAGIEGTWDLTITEAVGAQFPRGFAFTAVATLAQSGVSVSGTFLTAGGLRGEVTGTVTGSSFTFRIAQQGPCAGTFNGRAAVQALNRQMSGSYNGSDCGGIIQANFTATKRR